MPQLSRPTPSRRGTLLGAAASAAAAIAALLGPASALAAESPGAGGAPFEQIAIATIGGTLFTVLLLWLGLGHRSGRVPYLGRVADRSERMSGLPGWAAFPIFVAATSLLIAVFGMYWDIALHIDVGRDEGPLANPAHYFILFGLFGIFAAGYLSIMIPSGGSQELPPGPSAIELAPTWRAPLGGILICACGAFALIGFPLDDVWHRIFGQDVTLWGPTHLMLIGGASMTLIGIAVLAVEGLRANAVATPPRIERRAVTKLRSIALTGGLLLGLSTFQGEFDFGIPQFRFMLQPALIGIAAGVGLVAVRVASGRGSAFGAVAFFLLVRGILALLVGPVLGQTTPVTPLYLVAAAAVELTALAISTTKRPVRFAIVAGLAIGTAGLASEWLWSNLVMPIPLPSSMAGIGIAAGLSAAIAGSLVGAWIGTKLREQPVRSTRALRAGALIGAAGIAAVIGVGLLKTEAQGWSATVALRDVPIADGAVGSGGRTVQADITMNPANLADDAHWLTLTAWQGGGLIVDKLERVGPGRYRTTQPIPVHDDWKALIRLETGRSLMALPIYLPLDTAIPAPEVPAAASFTRDFRADYKVMQREQKAAAGWLSTVAYLTVAGIALALLVLLVWGLHRLGDPDLTYRPRTQRRRATQPAKPSGATTPQPAP